MRDPDGQRFSGARLADLNGDPSERLLLVDDEMMRRIAARWYALVRHWDAGDLVQAASHTECTGDHVDDYPDGFRQSLTNEPATFATSVKRGPVAYNTRLKRGSDGVVVHASGRALAEAALALLDGRMKEVGDHLDVAQRKLGGGLDTGSCPFTRCKLAKCGGA